MKHLTLKALFISAFAAVSLNVQAADTYEQCLADAEAVIAAAKANGGAAAREVEQKTTVAECMAELASIEAKYGDKTIARNPSSVMTPEDRAKWAKLFDAVDAKKYTGTRYNMAAYYR